MNSLHRIVVALSLAISFGTATAFAQGTTFTYQGRLNNGGTAASGNFDLRFALYDAGTNGTQQGNLLTNSIAGITNGLFTTTLDFGSQFPGAARWLEISVRTNGSGTFITLSPRQLLTPTPYAITASNLTGVLPAAQLSGAIANGNLPANATFAGAVAASSLAGNGANVTNVNAAALNGLTASNFWQLGGNNVAIGQFLGSTNNQPVEIWVNGGRAFRIESASNDIFYADTFNLIGGSSLNYITPGIYGSTISGGVGGNFYGPTYSNSIASHLAVIGGGYQNTIHDNAQGAAIGGGGRNAIQSNSTRSTIAGGYQNQIGITSPESTIGGGFNNQISSNTYQSVIAGGGSNKIETNAYASTIGGGVGNDIQPGTQYGTISGGFFNKNSGSLAGIASGYVNEIQTNSQHSFIGGGYLNKIGSNNFDAVIGGGTFNDILGGSGSASVIGGGYQNTNTGSYATIPGGYLNTATNFAFAAGTQAKAVTVGSFVWADFLGTDFASTAPNQFLIRAVGGVGINTNNPGGAALNVAGTIQATTIQSANFTGNGLGLTNVDAPTLGGQGPANFWQLGGNNVVAGQFLGSTNSQPLEFKVWGERVLRLEYGSQSSPNVVGGSSLNVISNGVVGATIAGGGEMYTIFNSTVYEPNVIGGRIGTISGGALNTIGTNSSATISGGYNNAALAISSTIGGGAANRIAATASYATISGGAVNTNSGNYATVVGGTMNTAAGDYTLAAGRQAQANHAGSFVWADSQNTNFSTTANNQFLVRAAGGVGINTNNPGATLDVNGSLRVGNGTTVFNNMQAGVAQMSTDSATVKTNFTFTFPKAFNSIPIVLLTPRNASAGVDDTFAVTVRTITTTSCTVNITRTDAAAGWGQHLQVTWLAWE